MTGSALSTEVIPDEDALQFYKTPKDVIRQLVGPYYSNQKMTILEPSAGDGAIIDYLVGTDNYRRHKVYCCEISADRRAILAAKKYNVIGTDFLALISPYKFSLVVMNPPFRCGVEHVLKAWELVASGGSLATILPRTAVEGGRSAFGPELRQLIDLFGEVEAIGSAFAKAERKTDVDCVIVRLKKPLAQEFDPFVNFNPKQDEYDERVEADNAPIAHDIVQAIVSTYERAMAALRTLNEAEQVYYQSVPIEVLKHDNKSSTELDTSFIERVETLKTAYWNLVFQRTGIGSIVTSNYRDKFMAQQASISKMEFSVKAVYEMLDLFMTNEEAIRGECVMDLFRELTRWDKDNAVAPFKTNKGWKLQKRIIVPYCFSYVGSWTINYQRGKTFDDMDKVLGMFGGLNGVCTERAIRERMNGFRGNDCDAAGNKYSDKFNTPNFAVRAFKKGTIHLEFRDLKVLEMLNRYAASREMFILGNG